jgi:undecaprenyl diphosphate synthase
VPYTKSHTTLQVSASGALGPLTPEEALLFEKLDLGRLPRHVAVIMDGNGRWAKKRGLPRIEGHRRGVASVRRSTEECARLHMDQLTLYCLSSENWKRPPGELDFLMHLLEQYMIEERSTIMEQNISVSVIGRRDDIPEVVRREMQKTIELSAANTGMRLCLAINYGSRAELVDAVRDIARRVREGQLDPAAINEATLCDALYTAGMPDPDLLIRTAGEMRLSNFLLWQISYAEIWVTEHCWPEFREADLHQAIRDYSARDRRFGGLHK